MDKRTYKDRAQYNIQAVAKRRRKLKAMAIEYKGGKCQVCGYEKSIGALAFHHRDPEKKDFNISAKSYAYERLKKEVDKCVLVCGNCHIEIHEEIQNKGYSDIINNIR